MDSKNASKSKPSRRERSKADKMRRILAAGEKLFTKQGYDGTTVQQIADEADIAVGTLFLYVSDKSELLLRIFYNATGNELEHAIRRMKASRKFLPGARRFLMELHAPYGKDRELAKVYCREVLFHKGGVRAELDKQSAEIVGALAEAIAVAQQRGDIDKSVGCTTFLCNLPCNACIPRRRLSTQYDPQSDPKCFAAIRMVRHGIAPFLK
jgi:AcrR family transcriptional regulator